MKVLVVNSGSSSIKYQLFDMTDESVLAKGLVERIGISDSIINHYPSDGEPVVTHQDIPSITFELNFFSFLFLPTFKNNLHFALHYFQHFFFLSIFF